MGQQPEGVNVRERFAPLAVLDGQLPNPKTAVVGHREGREPPGGETMAWIVIAWTEQEREWDGQPFAADLGERPGTVEIMQPYACVWTSNGGPEDEQRARDFCVTDRPDGHVFTYPDSETDPIGRAKQDVLVSETLAALGPPLTG